MITQAQTSFFRKMLLGVLFLYGFIYTYHAMAGCLDNDLGWQLAFGKTTLQAGIPYTDTATWTYFDKSWINHEWGSSILWWLLFSHSGYYSIVALVSVCAWLAFALVPWAFRQKISITTLAVSLFTIHASAFYLAPRPTILISILFVLLCATLERIPDKKWYWVWPLLVWLWAALHGSWILAFIIIGLYICGNILSSVVSSKYAVVQSRWTTQNYLSVIGLSLMSLAATCINPYGFRLWQEIIEYFTKNYYQQFITEWMPSYTYPIYWLSLIIITCVSVCIVHAYQQKKLSLTHALLLAAFIYAGFSHKRNITFALLLSTPLIAGYVTHILTALKTTFVRSAAWSLKLLTGKILLTLLACTLLTYHGAQLLLSSRYDADIFKQTNYLSAYGFPVGAAQTLARIPHTGPRHIFNEFHWGGYLQIALPNDSIYIDGRGTVSWLSDQHTSLYETYRDIRFHTDGLAKLNNTSADTIILHKNFVSVPNPDIWNRLAFPQNYLDAILTPEPTDLEKELRRQTHWRMIYEDALSELWVKK